MAELVPIAFEMPGEVERPRSRGRSAVNERVPIDHARPDWLKVRLPMGPQVEELRRLMRSKSLHTVCEEARCPNMAECWGAGTATFMILGDTCTRTCGFCAVKSGRPTELDLGEPARVGEAVGRMGLRHAVVTSVNRDELEDGGAEIFARTIREIRCASPGTSVEVLIPDFRGVVEALDVVLAERPEILNHNVETIERLYPRVRPQARFERSLEVLRRTKERAPDLVCKSGIMVGLGETRGEVLDTMRAIGAQGTDVLTIGQYLRPSPVHLPIERYWTPAEFAELRDLGMTMGFDHVESGPLVRSSYHAERHVGMGHAG
ncbi:MAG TPA: lipoyl synthase [Candidatus Limnocylindria bacterium]|nr:lipoyl synthase [Candidatus Limnocylindria bacterium]